MKILFINEYTKVKGGVDYIVDAEIDSLTKNGHDVKLFSINHKNLINFKIKSIKELLVIFFTKWMLKKIINDFKPDIIHIHNIYPLLGKILKHFKDNNRTHIIFHLHNYYPFCLNSFFYKNNSNCTLCHFENSWKQGIQNKCYNNSFIFSVLAAFLKPKSNNWLALANKVQYFIVVSNFVNQKYIELGLDKQKIKTIYNPNLRKSKIPKKILGDYILYLGNIVFAKGLNHICKLAEELKSIKFIIAGTGRDLLYLSKKYKFLTNIEFVGYVEKETKNKLIQNCRFLIFPTLWWEPFGMVVIEAFSFGKPVLTFRNGATMELVEHKKNGIISDSENLKSDALSLWNSLQYENNYFDNCLKSSNKYSLENHMEKLLEVYENEC